MHLPLSLTSSSPSSFTVLILISRKWWSTWKMSWFLFYSHFYYVCIYGLYLFWIVISVAESPQASPSHGYKWGQFNKISLSHKPLPMERQYLRFTFKVSFLLQMSVCISGYGSPAFFHQSQLLLMLLTPVDHSMLALPRLHCHTGATVK